MKKLFLITALASSLLLDAVKPDAFITVVNDTFCLLNVYYWAFNECERESERICITVQPNDKYLLDAGRFIYNSSIFVRAFHKNGPVEELKKVIPHNTQKIIIESIETPECSTEDEHEHGKDF